MALPHAAAAEDGTEAEVEIPDEPIADEAKENAEILSRWTPWWSTPGNSSPEHDAWSLHVLSALSRFAGPSLMAEPLDQQAYCPRWAELSISDRKGFYLAMISAMAKFESGFDPKTEYRENFKDQDGNWVISRGLLQLSVESANGYGCKVTSNALHDPKTNLTCALIIINRWVSKDGFFGSSTGADERQHRGGARYWAVLRNTSPSKQKILDFLKTQKMCQ